MGRDDEFDEERPSKGGEKKATGLLVPILLVGSGLVALFLLCACGTGALWVFGVFGGKADKQAGGPAGSTGPGGSASDTGKGNGGKSGGDKPGGAATWKLVRSDIAKFEVELPGLSMAPGGMAGGKIVQAAANFRKHTIGVQSFSQNNELKDPAKEAEQRAATMLPYDTKKPITLQGYSGVEARTKDGKTAGRLYLTAGRMHIIIVRADFDTPLDPAIVDRVFGSFKILE